MTKIKVIVVFLFFLAFHNLTLQLAFPWEDNPYRSINSYDTRSYDFDEYRHISGQPQPEIEPTFWQGFLSGMNNFLSDIKQGFTNVVDFSKNLFVNVKNVLLRPQELDTEKQLELKEQDLKVDKQAATTDSLESGSEFDILAQESLTAEGFFAQMESGQSIFEPTRPEQVGGQDVENLRLQLRQDQTALRGEEIQPGIEGLPADIFEPQEGPAIDMPLEEGKIADISLVQQPAVQDFEGKVSQVKSVTLLSPQKAAADVMPPESWEKVKAETLTPLKPAPTDVGQPTLLQKGKELLVPEAGAKEIEVKDDLIQLFKLQRFYFEEKIAPNGKVIPGIWVKRCPDRTVEEFPSGICLIAEANTEIIIEHVKDHIFEVKSSKPIQVGWGIDGAMFTRIKVEFNIAEMHMRVKEGLQGPAAWYLMREEGWDVK